MKHTRSSPTKNALKYLESLIPKERRDRGIYTLDRVRRLLDIIGNPETHFRSIHIGGTSGKGSTAYIAAAILKEAGYITGLHISPHLEKINERMQINGSPISDKEFTALVNWIQPHVRQVGREGALGMPTYFEVLVALSFEYFKRKKVDIAVVEVGLGGTLDATNVIAPEVAVITNVDLDHTEILGKTVEKIARDKAGIIKEGIEVITAAKQKSVLEIIKKRCREKHARLTIIKRRPSVPPLRPIGEHQKINAACAIAAIKKLGLKVSETGIERALTRVQIPGRFEVVKLKAKSDKLEAILDGAHNPAKMRSLVAALKKCYPSASRRKKFAFIFAAKKGKDAEAMLRLLAPLAEKFYFTQFFATTDFGKNQSMNPEELVKIIKKIKPTKKFEICETSREAVLKASKLTKLPPKADPPQAEKAKSSVCVTGSLYLVGEVRSLLVK